MTREKVRAGAFRLTMEPLLAAPEREDLPERVRQAVAEFLEMLDDIHRARERPLPELLDYILRRTGYAAWLHRKANGNGNQSDGDPDEVVVVDLPVGKEADAVHNLRLMLEGCRGEDGLARFLRDVEEMQGQAGFTSGGRTAPRQEHAGPETAGGGTSDLLCRPDQGETEGVSPGGALPHQRARADSG